MLVKGQSRLDGRKYSFFPKRTVNEWNEMSADCVHYSSSNMFKNSIQLSRKSRIHLDSYICGVSISERLPCPESFELLLGCQSC